MPRRREVPKREILPDPKFGNVELSKFMNVIMEGGKKAVAERIIYGALENMEKKTGKDPVELFSIAINNVKPMVGAGRVSEGCLTLAALPKKAAPTEARGETCHVVAKSLNVKSCRIRSTATSNSPNS